eukprot:gnl/TRDRNA2_/TRDRNA2_183856_c0_seq1.p1 gnl/TRDRNA2_/TRDRNA2_183856_c0~~gnl/TRDRNA2_/TRDRNA2_183856_c0_seq1.p1  ORF type:complete len:503 (+),score=67.53 gnl/TRDRNA2_/TRDRNA2_183856_c0_seq1:222-1730(+)
MAGAWPYNILDGILWPSRYYDDNYPTGYKVKRDRSYINMIENESFSLARLTKRHGQQVVAPGNVWKSSAEIVLIFALMIGATCGKYDWLQLTCWALAIALLLYRLYVIGMFGFGVSKGQFKTTGSIIYWGWWPLFMFVTTAIVALCAGLIGAYAWRYSFEPWIALDALQRYYGVNPAQISGDRLQDAGIVHWSPGTAVDRAHGGCFTQVGTTYCIAPIIQGGQVLDALGDAPATGSYDFFAVGIDCCTCPNQDFRCGGWNNPTARAGLRSVDYRSRPMYRLAVDDWTAAYTKKSSHPMFFEWVKDPEKEFNVLLSRTMSLLILAGIGMIPIAFALALSADRVLHILIFKDIAQPTAPPEQFSGTMGRMWSNTFPQMSQMYNDEQEQRNGVPAMPYGTMPGVWMPDGTLAPAPPEMIPPPGKSAGASMDPGPPMGAMGPGPMMGSMGPGPIMGSMGPMGPGPMMGSMGPGSMGPGPMMGSMGPGRMPPPGSMGPGPMMGSGRY